MAAEKAAAEAAARKADAMKKKEEAEAKAAAEAKIAEKASLASFTAELAARSVARAAQRSANHAADENRPSPEELKKGDSSVKKCSAFVKKLRSSLFENQRASLLSDLEKLNLTKYIPEVVSSLAAIAELPRADVVTGVAVASSVLQRYEGFLRPLREQVYAALKVSKTSEDKKDFRVYLRCANRPLQIASCSTYLLIELYPKHIFCAFHSFRKVRDRADCCRSLSRC